MKKMRTMVKMRKKKTAIKIRKMKIGPTGEDMDNGQIRVKCKYGAEHVDTDDEYVSLKMKTFV